MKTKLIKYAVIGIVGAASIIGALIFLNTLSCVTMQRDIEGEPIECKIANRITYYAVVTAKNGTRAVPESESTNASTDCRYILRHMRCKQDREEFWTKNKRSNNPYENLVLENQARSIYDNCIGGLKH